MRARRVKKWASLTLGVYFPRSFFPFLSLLRDGLARDEQDTRIRLSLLRLPLLAQSQSCQLLFHRLSLLCHLLFVAGWQKGEKADKGSNINQVYL